MLVEVQADVGSLKVMLGAVLCLLELHALLCPLLLVLVQQHKLLVQNMASLDELVVVVPHTVHVVHLGFDAIITIGMRLHSWTRPHHHMRLEVRRGVCWCSLCW